MTKKDYVLDALKKRNSGIVPYCIRLTGEAYNLYGEQLLKDFYNKDVQDDLKKGIISLYQAVDLSIGNYMFDNAVPWWFWNRETLPAVYNDGMEEPDVMPEYVRTDSDEAIEAFYKRSDYVSKKYGTYNTALIWGSHWEKANETRGIENFLADLALYPEFAQRLLDFVIDTNFKVLPKIAACDSIDGILLGSDWGTQNDLIMSPDTWRNMIRAGEKRGYDFIHQSGKDVMVHSCGNIVRILDDLVELNVDILNPVQPECMDLKVLKEKYGDKLTFWGGISTQKTLPYGTVEEVRQEAESVIKLMSKNGGYITAPSQEIQTDVPYENLKALIETAKSFT